MKTLIALALLLLAGKASAFSSASQPEVVAVSSFAYTNVSGAAHRVAKQYTLKVKNPSSQTVSLHGHLGACASAFTLSTSTVRGPILIAPSDAALSIDLGKDECLYLVAQNVGASTSAIVQGLARP